MKNKHYTILGGTGTIGAAVAQELLSQGKKVNIVARNADYAKTLFPQTPLLTINQADAMNLEQLIQATKNSDVIFNCINPPYNKWEKYWPTINPNTIIAAKTNQAKLVFADNIYIYGKPQTPELKEDHPHNAQGKKGQIRKRIHNELMEAHEKGDIKVAIARFGDYYGENIRNPLAYNYFVNPIRGKKGVWLLDPNQSHAFIYAKDAARALITLAMEPSAYGQVWHISHPEPLTGTSFFNHVSQALEKEVKFSVFTKWQIRIIGLFNSLVKELLETAYQWEYPLLIDGTKFTNSFPNFKFTPHKEAFKATINWYRQNLTLY